MTKTIEKVIDFVLGNFAIYNSMILKDLSHAESLWKNAHAGYGTKEHCTEQISHDAITEYFSAVNNKFDLSTDEGVKQYISSLGVV